MAMTQRRRMIPGLLNFLGPQEQAGAEKVHIFINALELIRADGQGGGAGGQKLSLFHKLDLGILKGPPSTS